MVDLNGFGMGFGAGVICTLIVMWIVLYIIVWFLGKKSEIEIREKLIEELKSEIEKLKLETKELEEKTLYRLTEEDKKELNEFIKDFVSKMRECGKLDAKQHDKVMKRILEEMEKHIKTMGEKHERKR